MRAADGASRAGWTILKVVEMRLRFVVLMVGTGLVFGYWDTLANHFEKWSRPTRGAAKVVGGLEYYCPMHPSVVLATSASCPICGMPLAKRALGDAVALPEGVLSLVRMTPGQVAQAGVKTVAVGFRRRDERMTTVGSISFDESRRFQVASNARGSLCLDRVYASSEGVTVQAGQRLADLYGYDMAQAIRVYRDAVVAREAAPADNLPATPLGDPKERVDLAIQGLKVLGVRQNQIEAIAAGSLSSELLPILAPISGHIVRKSIQEGQYVSEGQFLFEIVDLSRVWFVAQVFEDQLGRVEVGRRIEATIPTFPGEVFTGRVALIAPTLDPTTRTAAVRFEIDNPGHRLRPGMYATVTLNLAPESREAKEPTTCPVTGLRLGSMGNPVETEVDGRTIRLCCEGCIAKLKSNPAAYLPRPGTSSEDVVLSVPESAVVDTGSHKIVYVESAPGVFEGRSVDLGPLSGGDYPVLAGLASGERVAAAGAFLIDAESRLNPGATVAKKPASDVAEPLASTSRLRGGREPRLQP
ncbi:efflux RND transporter periplasmic adaptor subunit [Paludisphaera rhizosphaerae]|uniref:efflux RND transporter periplasmic adaptor subunit n=1 Tax=Paludisphaera rhizosphaerae TaxID=2711216 RepID=UPI0013EC66D8|nr:efflux RND transporter periplasmic adaptor subunit [Paludisphaera rhizosphaerae]